MIEYPCIPNSSKAPRKPCYAFAKFDGSSIRCKYTVKKGFCLFGSRTQLLDASHPHLGGVVAYFQDVYAKPLTKVFQSEFPDEREIIAFGEYFGPHSFAGIHDLTDTMKFVLFDILVRHNFPKFVLPQHFVKTFKGVVEIPPVVYIGNLTDQFIADVRAGKYPVHEGVVCKGTERTGAAMGHVWMAKIKTQKYIESLRTKFGEQGVLKFGE